MLDESTRTPVWNCPNCGYRIDSASGLSKDQPDPGDVSVCMKCGEVFLFAEDLTGRKPTVQELIDIQQSPSWHEILRVRWAIAKLHEKIAAGELEPFGE